MNIAFFLTPKKDVLYLKTSMTAKKALDILDSHSFEAMPVINSEGEYFGTLSSSDILRIVRQNPDPRRLTGARLRDMQFRVSNTPVRINCDIEDLVMVACRQNFVPVVDDDSKFIGIIKRSTIITYCYQMLFKNGAKEA